MIRKYSALCSVGGSNGCCLHFVYMVRNSELHLGHRCVVYCHRVLQFEYIGSISHSAMAKAVDYGLPIQTQFFVRYVDDV